jgi:hypothetical protein
MDENQQKQQFHQWLPFYVNGRLPHADQAWMNQYLAEHPKAAAEVQIEQALKETLQTELPDFSPNQGLETFMTRIRSDSRFAKETSLTESFRHFLNRCQIAARSLFITPQWAMAVTLVIVQTGIIGLLIANRALPIVSDQAEWRSVVSNSSPYQGPVLQITFKPSATEEEIRLLLVKIRGTLVGGPGQLGNYIVKVPDEKVEEAQKQVMSSPIIESVNLLQDVPVER